MKKAVYVFNQDTLHYKFHGSHPFNQERLRLTHDLLHKIDALQEADIYTPPPATMDDLLRVHTSEYIQAVQSLSDPHPPESVVRSAVQYGLGEGDTPYFNNMHNITNAAVGGSVAAAQLVMSGNAKRAVHLAGGLHHAATNHGAGFCVYNDAAVAIAAIRQQYHARVLYIDTDVHHGDGVQWVFYTDPNVFTFSIHETGKYLFPGTGGVAERGEEEGFGTCVNMPVEPYTEDESWLENFQELLERIAASFKPDIIISQHGCDAHVYDPLAHVQCSMDIYRVMPIFIRQLADHYCNGRWVALGGGGYDIWRVVPRAWSLVWLAATEHPLPEQIAANRNMKLPVEWTKIWSPRSSNPLPDTWLDDRSRFAEIPRKKEIEHKNRQTKELALLYLP